MQDTETTLVIFKKEGADVCAFFPELPGDYSPATCTAYAHVGQHSAASESYARALKPAKPEEFGELAGELTRMGYRLRIVQRFQRRHYLARRAALSKVK